MPHTKFVVTPLKSPRMNGDRYAVEAVNGNRKVVICWEKSAVKARAVCTDFTLALGRRMQQKEGESGN